MRYILICIGVVVVVIIYAMRNVFTGTDLIDKTLQISESSKVVFIVGSNQDSLAKLFSYEKIWKKWHKVLECDAFVGRNGISSQKKEGDETTPAGILHCDIAFGVVENPGSCLPYIMLDDTYYWVDDPKSANYNKLVRLGWDKQDWDSAEHLAEYKIGYKYVIASDYNTKPVISGKGSAVFLHVASGKGYTAGCVSVSEEIMCYLLRFIDEKTPIVIVCGYNDLKQYCTNRIK
ncbi:MAG: L,D-transpeptidase family protein [Endomicrobium sp.]|jgi:L,D-peptidoglycan transpeptidase YkuD (ErfK/YbiS/YcfS/YnhG family)|nr:L,D-transpeptidase family protein [Endomicrobium sp.]